MNTISDNYRSMQQDKRTKTEQTITDVVNQLEEFRQENELTHQQLLEMSDVAVRKLVYSKPIPPQVRNMFAEILKRIDMARLFRTINHATFRHIFS